MIIGISGLAGSGKDTCADFFVRDQRFVKVALADPIKRMCQDAFGFSYEQLWGESRMRSMPDRRYPRRPDYWEYPDAPIGSVWVPLFGDRGYALINREDFDRVAPYRWTLNKKEAGKNTDYVRATIEGVKVSMHSFLSTPPEGFVVDHINGNGLDNRRRNMRVCTKGENRRNSEKRKDGESVFKGVGRVADRDGWRAYINVNGKLRTIGYYDSEEEAALAYDDVARNEFGDFARLNCDRFLTPRFALQQLGTQWGRHCYPDTWIEYAVRVHRELQTGTSIYTQQDGVRPTKLAFFLKSVVIPDVRFKNEIDGLRAHGAKLIRVVRPSAGLGGAAGQHTSETEQTEIPDSAFDAVIQNDGTIAELEEKVRGWLG